MVTLQPIEYKIMELIHGLGSDLVAAVVDKKTQYTQALGLLNRLQAASNHYLAAAKCKYCFIWIYKISIV